MLNVRIAIGTLVLLDLDLWRRDHAEEELVECEGCEECTPAPRRSVGFKQED